METQKLPSGPHPTRFHSARPSDLRHARPWHRLAHIVRILPLVIQRLSTQLEVPDDGRVLDFGCAELPYRSFFARGVEYVGADLPGNPQARVEIAPDGTVALADEGFDAVLSTQVLEHVSDPVTHLAECHRVLRSGGRMLLSTHGIMVHHPDPVDYWRWTNEGLRRIVREAGFEIVQFEGIMGLGATGLQLVHDSVYYRLHSRRPQQLTSLVFQSLIRIADHFETPESREMNALVFALVAEKI